jgi:hypothetical protein
MSSESPQLAFNDWLAAAIEALCDVLRRDDAHEAFLARSVDLADLERRQRAMRIGRPLNLFW